MNNVFIHSSAVIDDGAQLGNGTKIWHFCHLAAGAIVGANCTIGQNVFIDNEVHIGDGVKVQNNVSLYKGVQIEKDVFIGPSAVFTNVINPRSFINRKHEFRQTIIRQGATIGANATVICGVAIGQYAMIGAGAVVTKNVAPFALVYGNPARLKGWVSKSGYKLIFNEMGIAVCEATGENYRLLNNAVFLEPQI